MEMLLTTEQAAQIARVHPETIRRQARKGTLRSVRIGRALRIPESALTSPDQTASSWKQAAKRMAPVYTDALTQGSELTASSTTGGAYVPTGEGGVE